MILKPTYHILFILGVQEKLGNFWGLFQNHIKVLLKWISLWVLILLEGIFSKEFEATFARIRGPRTKAEQKNYTFSHFHFFITFHSASTDFWNIHYLNLFNKTGRNLFDVFNFVKYDIRHTKSILAHALMLKILAFHMRVA